MIRCLTTQLRFTAASGQAPPDYSECHTVGPVVCLVRITIQRFLSKCLKKLAPRAGFEPATNRLTAGRGAGSGPAQEQEGHLPGAAGRYCERRGGSVVALSVAGFTPLVCPEGPRP
jgi:hypothetical protein